MKQQLILWLSSIILTFFIGYTRNLTDEHYPVTGAFGINGQKVSYKLDRIHYGEKPHRLIILTGLKNIKGEFLYKADATEIHLPLIEGKDNYYVDIPPLQPLSQIEYKFIIKYNKKSFEIPVGSYIKMIFMGKIPSSINILYFTLLYTGLLLAVRMTLDIFNKKKLVKKYIVIATSVFIILTIITAPLRNSYKLGAINNYIPALADIINPLLVLLVILWIAGTVLVFSKRHSELIIIILFTATLIIFFFVPVT
jgi:hypothetical protein